MITAFKTVLSVLLDKEQNEKVGETYTTLRNREVSGLGGHETSLFLQGFFLKSN